jgi:NPCBM-associated, NEW3 domain of alpha-galactosidase
MAISPAALSLAATLAAGALAIGGLTANAAQATTAPAAAATATIYASPLGAGTACTITAPCGITTAQAAVKSAVKSGEKSAKDIDVDLFGGTYHVPGGLQLGTGDSGSDGHDVVWQAVPGQQPVISGAVQVTGFTEYDKGKNLWRAPVSASSAVTGGQQLFVNGQRAELAQTAGSPPGVQVTSTGFSTTDPSYASFTNQSQIEVVDNSDWKHVSCPVQSITPASGGGSDINLRPSCWDANNVNVPNLGFPYNGSGLPAMSGISYVEDAYQLLTQPGQFYLDQAGHYLYYIPKPGQSMKTADVELPVDQNLLTLQGTPGHLAPVNQNDKNATYDGSGWQTYTDRGLGDLDSDIAATTDNGDSVTYTFTGTGLEVLGETHSDEGTFDAYVDGKQDTSQDFTENTSGDTRLAQQVIYQVDGLSKGTHTVTIVKIGGTYLTIDGFEVIPDALDPVRDIAFKNIAFEYSTWNLPETTGYIDNQAGVLWDTSGATPVPIEVPAAVTVSRGDDITFTSDTFEHLGATAVDLADGTQDSGVYSSLITDTAGGGVSVGEVDDYSQDNTALMTTGDTIAGDLISYIGQDYSDTVGVWAGYTRDLTVTHNDIGHTPYSGMSIGWGWGYASPCSMQYAEGLSDCEHGTNYAGGNKVTDNYIHDVMNTLYDGGPIYTNGGQAGDTENGTPVGSVLAGNYVSIGNHDDNMLYQDEGSSYWHTYDNVVNFAAGGNWIGMWTPTINNITIGPGNYSSTASTNNNGTDITYTPPTVVSDGAWPTAAQAIMDAAGPGTGSPRQASTYDDDGQALSYTGDWSAQGTLADQGDTHTTTSKGAAVTLNFTGRSIAFVTDEGPGDGTATVTIDGKQAGTIDTYAPFDDPGQTVFTDTDLSPGKHTITITDTDPKGGGLTVGEFQTPARPYLRVTTADPYPAAGASISVTATVGNPARTPLRDAKVALLAPPGWVAGKPVTLAAILPGGTATATFTVTPPASRSPGTATFTAVASSASGTLTGTAQAETPYGSLTTAFDNIGVSADSDTSAADLDGSGYSFSATALANAGVMPGSTVTAAGLTFSWPAAAAGSPDNVVASGQEVTIDRSGNELGFLDTATYGPASGEGTIIYADGSTQAFTLSVPDWYDGPPAGSSAAITTAYRNTPGNGQDDSPVYVYEQSVALDSSSEVAAVVLPDVSQGLVGGSAAVHIFAISAG